MQPVTATHIAYFHTCPRKLWLHANEIRMEHSSELAAEGKLIGETSQDRCICREMPRQTEKVK